VTTRANLVIQTSSDKIDLFLVIERILSVETTHFLNCGKVEYDKIRVD
jgi:hypothetical protein